jgi:hypothetical protein
MSARWWLKSRLISGVFRIARYSSYPYIVAGSLIAFKGENYAKSKIEQCIYPKGIGFD